jgi:hypothetical protein
MQNKLVAAGLTVVGFRQFVEEVDDEIWKNAYNTATEGAEPDAQLDDLVIDELANKAVETNPQCDLQVLFGKHPIVWSAPKQDLRDGALFFYLGKRARLNLNRCVKELKHSGDDYSDCVPSVLEQAKQLMEGRDGTIVAVARVLSAPVFGSGAGFKRRIFAECDHENLFILEKPLPYEAFEHIVKVYGQVVEALVGTKADDLRGLIARENELPEWFASMTFGSTKFSDLNERNWYSRITESTILVDESEAGIRTYFHDFVLNQLHEDAEVPILSEANSYILGDFTGRLDNAFRVGDFWIPFEAKVSISSERDFYGQILQYTGLSNIIGKIAGEMVSIAPNYHEVVLAGDQTGFYVYDSGELISNPEQFLRVNMSKALIKELKAFLVRALEKYIYEDDLPEELA